MSRKSSTTGPGTTNNTNSGESSTSNLKDLLTKGLAQTCTYSAEGGSGKVYVAGGKVRGDFDTAAEGKTLKSHMIVKDNTSYIWTDDQKTGFKMSFDPNSIDTSATADTSVTGQTANLNANYNYKCSTWLEDSSQFNLPSGVTFSSFEVPSAPSGGSSGSAPSSSCSYCNALSGDDKVQCLKALNCN